jgi:hypothetical protein
MAATPEDAGPSTDPEFNTICPAWLTFTQYPLPGINVSSDEYPPLIVNP